jgi:hypothetical protein
MKYLIKLPLPLGSLEACFTIACVGVRTPYEPIKKKSLKLLCDMIVAAPELSSGLGVDLFIKIVDMMTHKSSEIHSTASRFVSQCFAGDNTHLIDIAIEKGVFDHYYDLLSASSTDLVKETLWGISNITASSRAHISAFL